jgi:hypothetical protein
MTFGLIGAGLGIVMIVVAGAHRRLPDRGSMIPSDTVSRREAARGCSSRQEGDRTRPGQPAALIGGAVWAPLAYLIG